MTPCVIVDAPLRFALRNGPVSDDARVDAQLAVLSLLTQLARRRTSDDRLNAGSRQSPTASDPRTRTGPSRQPASEST